MDDRADDRVVGAAADYVDIHMETVQWLLEDGVSLRAVASSTSTSRSRSQDRS